MLKLSSIPWASVGVLRFNPSNQTKLQVVFSNWRKNACRTMVTTPYRVKKTKPKPWPYEEKDCKYYHIMMDVMTARYDENTKLVIVDGPINSGKREAAEKIAEAFEMKYMPPPTMDLEYINPFGYDMRNLDSKLPESLRSFDERNFNLDPSHPNAAAFQLTKYRQRFEHHMDTLRHIMNTGEGVVTVGSPFGDFIWAESMFQCGYISPQVRNYYYEVVRQSIHNLYRPHLIVYLDTPLNKTIENIKTKGADYEVNSKALTPEFLQCMEKLYKEKYLRESGINGEVVIADYSEESDVDYIIEDIEALDFEKERELRDLKFFDWRRDEWIQDYYRLLYSNTYHRIRLLMNMNFIAYDTPELFASDEEWAAYNQIWNNAPGMEYAKGFNAKRGDKNIWWKIDRVPKMDHT